MSLLATLIKKEFTHIKRNKFLPKLFVGFPIMVMLIIPLVTTLDVRNVKVAVVDNDHSSVSERIISKIEASDFFHISSYASTYGEALVSLEKGMTDVILEIPEGMEKGIVTTSRQKISLSSNAVNAIKGSLGMQYVAQTVGLTLRELQKEHGVDLGEEMIVVQNRYNPTLNYRHYMIPALMIMLLILICGFLPALSIVGEKEKGTIEQINVTPVSRALFVLSKIIPYIIIGLFVLTVAMLIAYLVYGLMPVGHIWIIYIAAVLFIMVISGLGLTIANGSETMQQTMFVMFFCLIVFILMSGLLTPITSMPDWAQTLTRFFPPRYFVDIMRSIYLKGSTLSDLLHNLIPLSAFAVLFVILPFVTYKKQA